MFSGFQSLIFGKKHHSNTSVDDTAPEAVQQPDDDYVLVERRHSTHNNVYPQLNPMTSLPYSLAPSLPSLPTTSVNQHQTSSKGQEKSDMLTGVPFQISSLISDGQNEGSRNTDALLRTCKQKLNNGIIEEVMGWNFNLEERILKEFQN